MQKTPLSTCLRRTGLLSLAVVTFALPGLVSGATYIVKGGQPRAAIVIADKPARMAKLAAEELQTYVEKMSGARLPILMEPSNGIPVTIYVGRSVHTDALKVTDDGLKYGAFRMVSGRKWLVLLGRDRDFEPKEPHLRNNGDMPRLMAEWDKVTGEKWGFPLGNLYKEYNSGLKIWEKDERGSLNAVYEFLRMQGVRWYLPDPLGEIVPKKTAIVLPAIDKTVRPDFALRYPVQYFHMFAHEAATRDEVLWQLRLGLDQAPELFGEHEYSMGHGITPVHDREEVKKAHPEYYGVFGGKRDTEQFGGGRPCLSSPGLFAANVKYIRTLFDHYDAPMVSVMPQDGYATLCECDLCKGKGTPERGWEGQISDYVWDYVNRVAKEVYKTHPNRKVSCLAYGGYMLPPTTIALLSSNIVVGIAQGRVNYPEPDTHYAGIRKAWLDKLPEGSKHLWMWEYYLYGQARSPWVYMPVFFPHVIARDLRALKGVSLGEFIEVQRQWDPGIADLAVTHLNLYVTARLWWDADQDVDALLDEYYTLFYGPARSEMKAFIEYSEANYLDMGKKVEKIGKAFELLAKAQKKAPADSVYARRIALIADYIKPMKDLGAQLSKGRENVPEANTITRDGARITLDGRLDEEDWQHLWGAGLSEIQTGRAPAFPTSFRLLWADNALYVGIECREPDTASLDRTVRKPDDSGIWQADCVEFLLETQTHSYYQLAISPAGTLVDMDRKDRFNTLWSSGAQVATHVGENGWSIEMRLPLAAANQEALDPLNGVEGRKPTAAYPWFFNVCRQRRRSNGTELSAFSPPGEDNFHVLTKFGKLFIR